MPSAVLSLSSNCNCLSSATVVFQTLSSDPDTVIFAPGDPARFLRRPESVPHVTVISLCVQVSDVQSPPQPSCSFWSRTARKSVLISFSVDSSGQLPVK